MNKKRVNIQQVAYLLIVVFILFYTAVIASNIILPILFGVIFTLLFLPICRWLERFISNKIFVIIITFLVALIPLLGITFFFTIQFVNIFEEVPSLSQNLEQGISTLFQRVNYILGIPDAVSTEWIKDNASSFLEAPASFIGQSLSSSSVLIGNIVLCVLYCFFLLLYRSTIKQFLLYQFSQQKREKVAKVLKDIQLVVQKYLSGLLVVMLVLGIINSTGLYFIGIPHAFFWGFLAAFLAVIPYIGTFIGGLLPFLFSLTVTTGYLQPLLVVVLFAVVQAVEGNIITPKIVGSSVSVNPLAAILALVVGGTIWGVGGLILAIPLVAILRVLMGQIDYLKPISYLLKDDIESDENIFEEKFDNDRFRLGHFFRQKRQ